MPQVHIVDYGVGNIGSLVNMVSKTGHKAEVSKDPKVLLSASKIILPGVGSFDAAIERLRLEKLDQVVVEAAKRGTPILGVCLGMQLLMNKSEEGKLPGLGLIEGIARKFNVADSEESLLIPHMGWNEVNVAKSSRYIPSLGIDDRYYFVHSYYVETLRHQDTLGLTTYGRTFASAIEKDNVIGVQFHPEKSHKFGARLLSEFVSAE